MLDVVRTVSQIRMVCVVPMLKQSSCNFVISVFDIFNALGECTIFKFLDIDIFLNRLKVSLSYLVLLTA